jgi:hypothetical protein
MSHSDNEAPIRGHRSEMPLYYDEFYIDYELLNEVLKPFEQDKNIKEKK